MGRGPIKKGLPEIDETRAAGRDAAFDAIVERIKSSGAEIISDEETPLYTTVGMDDFETGIQRVIEFNLNKTDFQLIRKVEEFSLQGAGHQKHLEELDTPRARITLKKKSELTNTWQLVDLDEMF